MLGVLGVIFCSFVCCCSFGVGMFFFFCCLGLGKETTDRHINFSIICLQQ